MGINREGDGDGEEKGVGLGVCVGVEIATEVAVTGTGVGKTGLQVVDSSKAAQTIKTLRQRFFSRQPSNKRCSVSLLLILIPSQILPVFTRVLTQVGHYIPSTNGRGQDFIQISQVYQNGALGFG